MATKSDGNQIKNAYSYIRLSSKRQTQGDRSGIDRQTEGFAQVCERNQWTPQIQTFADLGVSGYSGANFKGDLGRFMLLAKEGKLAVHPVLVVESLDRFSRQDIDESEPAVMDLLKAGVAIHIKFSGQTFTRASAVDLGDRIQIMVALKAAYNYSQQLSERVTAAKTRKLARLERGENVNLGDFCPSWIVWDKDASKLTLNNKAEAVKIIFNAYQNGKSLSAICRQLNETIKAFHGGNWTKQTVRKILSNPAAYGEFRGKANVFPAVISKEQFDAIQLTLSRNSGVKLNKGQKATDGQAFGRRGRTSKVTNIFRGLVRCSGCGKAMSMHSGRSQVYYRCDAAVNHACDNHLTARMDAIELSVIGGIQEMTPHELLAANDKSLAHEISQLNLKREALTKKLNALLELAGVMDTIEIKVKMLPLKNERDQLDSQISKLQNQANLGSKSPEALSIVQRLFNIVPGDYLTRYTTAKVFTNDLIKKQLANEETRKQLANVMPGLIKTVTIDGNSRLETQFIAGGTKQALIGCVFSGTLPAKPV